MKNNCMLEASETFWELLNNFFHESNRILKSIELSHSRNELVLYECLRTAAVIGVCIAFKSCCKHQ